MQQGAELAYLLLHDPEFRAKVRKEHLREVGKRIRLKSDIQLLYQLWRQVSMGIVLIFMCCRRRRGR